MWHPKLCLLWCIRSHSYWSSSDSQFLVTRPAFVWWHWQMKTAIDNICIFVFVTVNKLQCHSVEYTEMAVNIAKSQWMLTSVGIGMMSGPWCVAFRRWSSLLAFVSTSPCVLLIQSTHVHVWFAEKWLDLNLTCLSAHFDNVMFAS